MMIGCGLRFYYTRQTNRIIWYWDTRVLLGISVKSIVKIRNGSPSGHDLDDNSNRTLEDYEETCHLHIEANPVAGVN